MVGPENNFRCTRDRPERAAAAGENIIAPTFMFHRGYLGKGKERPVQKSGHFNWGIRFYQTDAYDTFHDMSRIRLSDFHAGRVQADFASECDEHEGS